MRVVHLAAGAAGMYCGTCLHDCRLTAALRAQGRDVVLVPLYTPLRSDEMPATADRVYFGGLNVYLQHISALFRHTPWFLDRMLDSPTLLRGLSRFTGSTRPEALGRMTLSVLQAAAGPQRKEITKLIAGLRQLKPDLIYVPNLMFAGVARDLKAALHVPVLCGLTGEDIFLDRLPPPYAGQVFDLIRTHAAEIDGFIALTSYYARHAAEHFGLPGDRVRRIPMGINAADFPPPAQRAARPFTIGYLARICPEKGLIQLAQATILLRRAGRDFRLRVAGYLGAADRPYLDRVRTELHAANIGDNLFEFVGEIDRPAKLEFLQSLNVLSVPTVYPESKGFYILEALAAGVPVVQPAHGSFPELVAATNGGLLFGAGSAQALADELARLMDNPPLRQQLANQGRAAVQAKFTAERMAAAAWSLYEQFK